MRGEVELRRIGPIKVAFVQLTGPYEAWGKGLMELRDWLAGQKVSVGGKPIGLFYDNPTETNPEELKSDACLPVVADVRSLGRFQVKELPGGEIAVTRHTGPPAEFTKTYGSFLEGLLSQGYEFYGPAREIFEEPSPDLRPGMGLEIQQLVKRNG